jgi:predicted phage terminase large subunit-like protein
MNENQILNAILRTEFKQFVRKVFSEISADTYLDNWHIDVICHEIMDMIEGKNNRLIVNIPPRYMKSIICSVALPAFLLGHHPETNIICVSYNDQLAEKFASDCRRIMMQPWYQELFPWTHLRQSRKSVNDFETTRGGGRMSTSIGGMLVGRGADWLIIDDPQKPVDAMSDTQRNHINNWYGSTCCTRLNNKAKGKIMLIMQRLHMNDLTGFLLESDAGFKLIKLPVIAQEDEFWEWTDRIRNLPKSFIRKKGELLHPERDDMDAIKSVRDSQGEYGFSGQFQQEPVPLEGGIVKEKWLQYYDIEKLKGIDARKIRQIYISWDTACKTGENNAYSACCIIAMVRENSVYKYYLLGVCRDKWEMPELVKVAKEIYDGWKYKDGTGFPVKMLIEDKASGTQLIQLLNKDRDKYGRVFDIEAIKPDTDKVSRLYGASVYIQRGELLFPENESDWWNDFKKELLGFPSTKYKDQVDALTQCINYIQTEQIW